jgi:ATP-dependent Zn protease
MTYNRRKTLTPQEVSERCRNIPLKHTAYHEAGHAVMAYRVGHGIKKVTITPNRGTLGKYVGSTPRRKSPDAIRIDLAGALAEALVNPIPFDEHIQLGAHGDWQLTRRSVREFVDLGFIPKQERDILIDELLHDTRALVRRDKEAITSVAEALLERKTLTGDDVRRIVEAVR